MEVSYDQAARGLKQAALHFGIRNNEGAYMLAGTCMSMHGRELMVVCYTEFNDEVHVTWGEALFGENVPVDDPDRGGTYYGFVEVANATLVSPEQHYPAIFMAHEALLEQSLFACSK